MMWSATAAEGPGSWGFEGPETMDERVHRGETSVVLDEKTR